MTSMTSEQSTSWIVRHDAARVFYAGRRVAVIGASGFLGSNCLTALLQLGAQVTALTRRRGSLPPHEHLRVVVGDLHEPDVVAAVVDDQDVVVDLAGVSGAVASNQMPAASVEADCIPQVLIAQRCAMSPRRPFVVFCSTRLVYGHPQYLPVDEDHPVRPDSIYAVNKLANERFFEFYGRVEGLAFCVFRLSNPYGPHPIPRTGGYGVINQFIRKASRGETISIYGSGGQRRDYVYVDDVVGVFLLAPMTPQCAGETFNLGGSSAISIADAVETISRLAGGSPVSYVPWPEEDERVETGDYRSDLTKLHAFLELGPQVSFEHGVARTLAACRDEARG